MIDLNGDLKFDHNKTDHIDNRQSRDIGNRLLALHIIELTVKLGGKIAILAAVIWLGNAILQRIDKASDSATGAIATSTPCGPYQGRIHSSP